MAKSSSSIWECRADAASIFNGAGFDGAFGGVDLTQSATAALTVTDVVTTGTTAVTSATGGFLSTWLGNYICVQGDGWYQIVAWVSTNAITVDRATGTGTGQTGRVGGAYLITANSFGFAPVAGNKVWVKAGTYSVSVNAVGSGVGSAVLPFTVEGYNTTRGDITLDPTLARPLFNRTGSTISMISLTGTAQIWSNIECVNTGSSSACVTFSSSATDCIVENLKLTPDNGSAGIDDQGKSSTMRNCTVIGGTGLSDGIQLEGSVGAVVEFCHLKGGSGNTGAGIRNTGNGNIIRKNIIERYSIGVMFDNTVISRGWLKGNSLYLNGTAVKSSVVQNGAVAFIAEDNLFDSSVTYDADYSVGSIATTPSVIDWLARTWRCNYFYPAARYHNLPTPASDHTLTATPFTSASTGDFSLNNTTGGGALVRAAACTVVWGDGVNTSYSIPGHVGNVPLAADTGTTTMRSLWRQYTGELSSVIADSVVDVYLDAGLEWLNRLIRYYQATSTSDIVLLAGTQEYSIPSSWTEVLWVQINGQEIQKGDIEQWRGDGEAWRAEPNGFPRFFATYANKIVFRPAPDAATVALASSPVIRVVTKPDSITTSGPLQLQSQDYRIAVFLGVAEWSYAFPDSAIAAQRGAYYQKRAEDAAQEIAAQYARRGISR